MKTIIRKLDEKNIDENIIQEAGQILREGGLVAFPTETVYGLGANALDEEAAAKTYAAKGRPSDNPLIVHIAELSALDEIAEEIPLLTESLANRFWPGPLTMIFKKKEMVPYGTTGGLETVAVRMPENLIALELIRAAGGYVSAPSANTSGRPSPTMAEHVWEDLDGKIDMILDGGSVEIGLESTILDMTVSPPMILRPGAITKEMLEKVIFQVEVDQTILNAESKAAPKAPGMKYRHYAPKAELTIVEGSVEDEVRAICQLTYQDMRQGKKVGIIATEENMASYKRGIVKNIGTRDSEKSIAHNLYGVLRDFDKEDVDVIYSESFAVKGMGSAIMNRLEKAAGHRRISAEEVVQQQKYRKIIFLTESDTIRGPMAAEMLKVQDLDHEFEILSRGIVVLFPEPLNQKVEVVMASHNLHVQDHMSKVLDSKEVDEETLILALGDSMKQKAICDFGIRKNVYTLHEFVGEEEPLLHPIGQPLGEYEKCYQQLRELIIKLTEKLNNY